MLFKNVASQKCAVFAYTKTDGTAKTGDAGNITAYVSKDGGAAAQSNDVNPTEIDATNMPGMYVFDLTQAETNCDLFALVGKSATSNILVDPVFVYTEKGYIDGAITSRAPSTTALSNATWTDAKAGYLDVAVSSRLAPTVAARTLDVSAGGAAGVDWANLEGATTANNLTATQIASVNGAVASVSGAVASVTGAVGSVSGAVGSVTGAVGSVTGDVGGKVLGGGAGVILGTGVTAGLAAGAVDATAMADNAIDAASIATGAITSAKFAAGAIDAAAIANGAIDAATFAAGAIDSAAIATGAIDADALAADAATELVTAIKAATIDGALTLQQVLACVLASTVLKIDGAATATAHARNYGDSLNRVTWTTDADGNRTACTLDLTGL